MNRLEKRAATRGIDLLIRSKAWKLTLPISLGIRDVKTFNTKKDVKGFLAYSESDIMYIVIPGTNSIKDFITDIKFWKKKVPYGITDTDIRVHTGFLDAYNTDEMRGMIHAYISGHPKCKTLYILGHSMGAGIAPLCAVDVQYNWSAMPVFNDPICIITGAPPLGNRAFDESYNIRVPRTYRIQNGDDVLSKFNLLLWLANYKRAGNKVTKIGVRHWWQFWGSWKDHQLPSYLESMRDLEVEDE